MQTSLEEADPQTPCLAEGWPRISQRQIGIDTDSGQRFKPLAEAALASPQLPEAVRTVTEDVGPSHAVSLPALWARSPNRIAIGYVREVHACGSGHRTPE